MLIYNHTEGYMASNIINCWFINYKPSTVLEAIVLVMNVISG